MLADKEAKAPGRRASRRSRGRPRLDQVADIENELLEVALEEFLEHGYGGTSIANIVKAAGVSKTTLYSRYSSKSDLFLALMQKAIEEDYTAQLMQLHDSPLPLAEGLKTYSRCGLQVATNPTINGLIRLIYGEAHRFPELRAAGEKQKRDSVDTVKRFIASCAEKDGIPCRDPEVPAEALVQMLRGRQLDAMISGERVPEDVRDAWVDRMVDLLLLSREQW